MKKLINATDAVVAEALRGFEAAHSDLVRVNHDPAYIVRADAPVKGKVGVVSGGGSGHEPMHGGFVGMGMLDAACPGEVFTSPTPDQMYEATKAVDGGAGVLHIVKNYTGDVLNFEMAADLARADGHRGRGGRHGRRRGRAGQPLHRRPARRGRDGPGREDRAARRPRRARPLAEVAELCRRVNAQGRSMGMALTSCTVPAAGSPPSSSATTRWRSGSASTASRGASASRSRRRARSPRCWRTRSSTTCPSQSGDEVLAFVNGMGGTPLLELYIVYNELRAILDERGVEGRPQPRRAVHHLAGDGRLLDHAPQAGRRDDTPLGRPGQDRRAALGRMSEAASASGAGVATAPEVASWIRAFAAAVAEHKDELTELDQAIGDADHGINMDRGMRAVVEQARRRRARRRRRRS